MNVADNVDIRLSTDDPKSPDGNTSTPDLCSNNNQTENILNLFVDSDRICRECGHSHRFSPKLQNVKTRENECIGS